MTPFTVQKFRTMKQGVSQDIHRDFVIGLIAGEEPERIDGKPQFKLAVDPRVTRLGRFLRRSSLDELPQLWNVLRGRDVARRPSAGRSPMRSSTTRPPGWPGSASSLASPGYGRSAGAAS